MRNADIQFVLNKQCKRSNGDFLVKKKSFRFSLMANMSLYQQVDPEAMKGSPFVVPWLRLVQAAVSGEEQNTEAYLKGGQLHFRTIRDVKQGEELLVWYDEELSHLLGFGDIKTKAVTDGE